jgi:hypothetical protein
MTPAERTAAHEAGHACARVVLGVPVRLIDVVGDATALGVVRHDLEQSNNRDDARKRTLIILCGQIEGADHWAHVPSWPLYREVAVDALNLTLDPLYQSLHVAVTGMVGYTPRIGPKLIGRLIGLARER